MSLCIVGNAIVSLACLCSLAMLASSAGSFDVVFGPLGDDGDIVSPDNSAGVVGRNGWRHVHPS